MVRSLAFQEAFIFADLGCGAMPTPRLPRTLLAVPALAALAATAATAAGCGNASNAQATPTSGPVAVTLDEWKVAPSATTVKAGAVSFDVTNAGRLPHEMVVLKATTPAARLASDGTPRVKETGRVGEVGELKPGTTGRTTITLAPGHYVLICNLPGHWTAGMRTDLTVR
jgi:uncharacterized cupredoxin-like copper-binding protein